MSGINCRFRHCVLGRRVAGATTDLDIDLLSTQTSLDETSADAEQCANDGYFAPFDTSELSTEYFQRYSVEKFAPIINVAKELIGKPFPTNKWWGNLVAINVANKSMQVPAWTHPYALTLPRVAPFGLQVCFSYTYREIAPVVNGTVKYYTHGIHNDLTLSAREFNDTKPDYEVYSFDDLGVKLRTCVSNTSKCMDSALLTGMAFVSAKYDYLTPRIDTEHNITYVDDSAPGKFIIYLNNNQIWVLYASDKNISFRVEESVVFSVNASGSSLVAASEYSGTIRIAVLPENVEATVYDKFAPCVVRGGSISMESRTAYSLHWDAEGSTCESAGLLHFALETLYGGITTRSIYDSGQLFADFGSGIYNDHHYHYGYFIFSAAIIKFLDPNWPRLPELEIIIWIMLRDIVNPSHCDHYFTKFRMANFFHGHAFSRGVTLLEHGKDEESISEETDCWYGVAMWGRVTGRKEVEDLGSLILRLNAFTIRTYFLLTLDNTVHPPEIVRNCVTGIFFENKVLYNTWFLDEVFAIYGIQMLPASPCLKIARTYKFVKNEWDSILSKLDIVATPNSNITWLSLLLVNAAVLDPINSLQKLKNASMDNGLSLLWALYLAATS